MMVVVSLGDHIFMPLRNSIGITVAKTGREGRVIGMMDATGMVLYLAASLPILFLFGGKEIADYRLLFYLAAGAAVMAGLALFGMRTRKAGEVAPKARLVFKRKFWLYTSSASSAACASRSIWCSRPGCWSRPFPTPARP